MTYVIEGFKDSIITVPSADGPIDIACQTAGSGPALLLLHGFPQTKAIWRHIAPQLAKRFSVVVTDLRGYGASSKPAGTPDHSTYSKRSLAADQHAVMQALGHKTFSVLGHDRGGRVSHRLAMDFPESIERLMVLDISPTLAMYENTSMEFARGYWHWFFLIQAHPIPETLIGANPKFWIKNHMGRHAGIGIFDSQPWSEYLEGASNPASLHAMCEDYRASASIDLIHDRADRDAGKKLPMPLRVLWGDRGLIAKCFSPIDDWKRVAVDVSGRGVPCGHYIPEELPQELLAEAEQFFA